MKQLTLILLVAGLMIGCGSRELTKEEALTLIKKERPYPRVVDYDIFTADPEYARKLMDKGLETDGFVTIQQTQALGEAGNPLIAFTHKAKAYLLATPEDDLKLHIQKVKVADEDVVEISSIERDNNTSSAVVHYSTVYSNLTPFAVLLSNKVQTPKQFKVRFILTDGKWVMEDRNL